MNVLNNCLQTLDLRCDTLMTSFLTLRDFPLTLEMIIMNYLIYYVPEKGYINALYFKMVKVQDFWELSLMRFKNLFFFKIIINQLRHYILTY